MVALTSQARSAWSGFLFAENTSICLNSEATHWGVAFVVWKERDCMSEYNKKSLSPKRVKVLAFLLMAVTVPIVGIVALDASLQLSSAAYASPVTQR